MIRRCTGGPAPIAGPLLRRAARAAARAISCAAVTLALAGVPRPAGATDWIPPARITALLPSAVIAPGVTRPLTLTLRANGSLANVAWAATSGGAFVATLSPSSGVLSVPANSIASVTINVTVPALAVGSSSISVDILADPGGARLAKVGASITAASDGRPEVWPSPSTWSAASGTSGSVSFQVHSMTGTSETVLLTGGRFNPDPNNAGGLFAGSPPPASALLPGGGTITVNVPTTIPARSFAGNGNAVQLSVTNSGGVSNASGFALSSASLPDSLPTALVPMGLTPLSAAAAGRDGAALLASRGYWLVPSGEDGVRVIRTTATDSIGMIDGNGDGGDDRVVGTIRIPSYAAALSILPGFVTTSGDTLDLGLLAAGRGGLMLLDLRTIEDPLFGDWSDFFDVDRNGVDDRILRVIPTSGFATDAAWVRTATGRHVGLVADADTGSIPVAASYDPALVISGTGAGVVAVDLEAAIDSLGGVPYAAGTLPTPGSALDLELRGGGSAPEMALADGSGGVAFYGLTFAPGAPASVTFTPRGNVALSGMWGSALARDLAWVANTGDSAYVAVATGAGGVQLVRAPRGGQPPALVLVQQTVAPAVGLASAWTGTLGVAMEGGGVSLLRVPGASELDKIQPGAPAPYTQPVSLSRVQSWGASGGLERALHVSWATSSTSLRFRDMPGFLPDLVVSDGARLLVLRSGTAAISGVAVAASPAPAVPALRVAPNPSSGAVWLEASRSAVALAGARSGGAGAAGSVGSAGGAGSTGGAIRIAITDVRGRLVRTLRAEGDATRVRWDGRDDRGRPAASGRYWARLLVPGNVRTPAASITILR